MIIPAEVLKTCRTQNIQGGVILHTANGDNFESSPCYCAPLILTGSVICFARDYENEVFAEGYSEN